MRDSRAQLEAGDLTGAGDSQDDVINALREAGQALADAINRRQGDGAETGEANAGDARDPLGRQNGNGLAGNDNEADIDSGDNAARARDLLEELRRRAAEQGRAPEELEYLQRLLKRF